VKIFKDASGGAFFCGHGVQGRSQDFISTEAKGRFNRGSGGAAPSGVQGESPWSGSQGAKPPEAQSFSIVG